MDFLDYLTGKGTALKIIQWLIFTETLALVYRLW